MNSGEYSQRSPAGRHDAGHAATPSFLDALGHGLADRRIDILRQIGAVFLRITRESAELLGLRVLLAVDESAIVLAMGGQ